MAGVMGEFGNSVAFGMKLPGDANQKSSVLIVVFSSKEKLSGFIK